MAASKLSQLSALASFPCTPRPSVYLHALDAIIAHQSGDRAALERERERVAEQERQREAVAAVALALAL